MVIKYERVKKSQYRNRLRERNDCGVITLALVCRTNYEQAHQWLQEQGRKSRKSTYVSAMIKAVEDNGFKVVTLDNLKQTNGSKYTPKTIGARLRRGYYICYSQGHIFAVINGIVEDWTNARNHRIIRAYQVIRPRG